MKTIEVARIIPVVKKLCIETNYYIAADVRTKVEQALARETSPTAREILEMMLQNYELAASQQMPLCQDTGLAVVFVELGQDVHLTGGDFTEAINEGVRQGYAAGYLRKAVVDDQSSNV
jgi:fumarate hydratase subunit alpha